MLNNNKLKVIVETKTLATALFYACSVADKRNVMTELSHIKLSAKNNKLELVATDMDLYLSQKIDAQILGEGEVTLSIWTLADIVKKISDKEITLTTSVSNNQLEIIGKNCNFKLMTGEASTFPIMDDITAEAELSISSSDFVKIIDSTKFSVSADENRYSLNGIYLHIKDGKLCAASTDGHRLSVSSIKFNKKIDDFGVILPKKTAYEVLKILKDSKNITSEIKILLSYNKIKFILDEHTIILSKLIDGTFPEYNNFIPKESSCKLVIKSRILADAINRVSIVTIDKFRAVKLILSMQGVEISASGEARGEAKESILSSSDEEVYCNFDGIENLTIGFNPLYLTDVLDTIKLDKVELYFNDTSSPVLIKFPESSDEFFIVMPAKV